MFAEFLEGIEPKWNWLLGEIKYLPPQQAAERLVNLHLRDVAKSFCIKRGGNIYSDLTYPQLPYGHVSDDGLTVKVLNMEGRLITYFGTAFTAHGEVVVASAYSGRWDKVRCSYFGEKERARSIVLEDLFGEYRHVLAVPYHQGVPLYYGGVVIACFTFTMEELKMVSHR